MYKNCKLKVYTKEKEGALETSISDLDKNIFDKIRLFLEAISYFIDKNKKVLKIFDNKQNLMAEIPLDLM